MKVLILAVVLAAAVLFLMRRRGGAKAAKQGSAPSKKVSKAAAARLAAQQSRYRATVIVCKAGACDAAKALADKPFLDSDSLTPHLPLPECDAPHCECSYEHREDRRIDDEDRRLQSSLRDSAYMAEGNDNRRGQRRGRRSSD